MANKGLEGPAFNAAEPFGRTFHGEGKPRKSDLDCVFFQNGLYYDAEHNLVNNDHNQAVLQTRNPTPKTEAPAEPAAPVPDLSGESDDTVFRMALNLYNKLAKRGETPDFEPSVEAREENLNFLASHS